jgi:hypothetical protein
LLDPTQGVRPTAPGQNWIPPALAEQTCKPTFEHRVTIKVAASGTAARGGGAHPGRRVSGSAAEMLALRAVRPDSVGIKQIAGFAVVGSVGANRVERCSHRRTWSIPVHTQQHPSQPTRVTGLVRD